MTRSMRERERKDWLQIQAQLGAPVGDDTGLA